MSKLKAPSLAAAMLPKAAIACAALFMASAVVAIDRQPMKTTTRTGFADESTDGRHGFDFLLGRWNVHNRRLARRLEGNNEWQEFPAVYEMRFLLGGLCNIGTYEATLPTGQPIEGILLRCFNPQTRKWSVYWNDSVQCELQPPVIGEFKGDRIDLYGDDTFNGSPIRVRCVYEKFGPDVARWEQAFWNDEQKSWETNWVMEFKRASAETPPIKHFKRP